LNPLSGALKLNACKAEDIAYLPQQAEIDRTFPITLREFVTLGLWRSTGAFGRVGRAWQARIDQAISAVGLEGFDTRPIGTLSGGQMQRVLFARLLLQDAPVILLDEPFTAIDAKTTSDLLGIVRRWHDEERTVIAVLHDMEVVQQHFPEALLIAREQVAWGPAHSVLAPENLLKARGMAEAWDDHADFCHRDAAHA
jgi:zinc/manganese transport system ATP-binding protein